MYILGLFDKIGSAINDAIRALNVILSELIYNFMIFCFNVFERIGGSNLLRDSSLQQLFNKISLILGLFMVFRITFSFVQYIMNPDEMFDKQKGMVNIIKKVIISIVLLGSVSAIFNLAYDFQSLIIEKNIIAKVILGNETTIEAESDATGGELIAENLFFSFFRIREGYEEEYKEIYESMKIQVLSGNFNLIKTNVNAVADDEDYVFEFDGGGLGSLAVGGVALWIIMVYTVQVGIRLFQLGYLQIISPLPIMMYITPKGEENLKKWAKQCSATFLDFFMRSAIMYFIVFIIKVIINDFNNKESLSGLWFVGEKSGIKNAYIMAILIIAFLSFAKKLPNLFKEIFPSMSGAAAFDYGIHKDKSKKVAGFGLGAVIGGTAGAIAGHGVAGKLGGFAKGAVSGAYNGVSKNKHVLNDTGAIKELKTRQKDIRTNRNEQMERNRLLREGEKVAKYRDGEGHLQDTAFKSAKFKASWNKVNEAKKALKDAEKAKEIAYERWRTNQTETNRTLYENEASKCRAAEALVNERKKDHENNRKIFVQDARREDAYEYYDHLHPFVKEQSEQSEDNTRTEARTTPSGIYIPSSFEPSRERSNTPSSDELNQQHEQLISRYNNATGAEKEKLRRELDDFERRN